MDADGCVPDAITHSTIVKGYCVGGDLDAAFEVFRNMQSNSMARDSIVYNTVLDGCTRHARYDLADELLADMERFSIAPSNFTLGILVKMWGRRKQLRKAFEVFEEIPKRYGLVPNALVRTSLVTACLHNNSLDEALRVFDGLRATLQGADSRIFRSLIATCVRQGHIRRAVALVEDAYGLKTASRRALPPNQTLDDDVMESLLRALVRDGRMDEVAMPLIEKLRAANSPVSGRILSSIVGSGGGEPFRRG
jgi:pentatricopeptide repeat protein